MTFHENLEQWVRDNQGKLLKRPKGRIVWEIVGVVYDQMRVRIVMVRVDSQLSGVRRCDLFNLTDARKLVEA